jgi:hypothetical protein
LGGERIQLGLPFFAQQAGKLGQRNGLFGCVDDGFDLGFKCTNPAPMLF